MGRKKIEFRSMYSLRNKTGQDPVRNPSVPSPKVRHQQQKKMTNVSTLKSSLLGRTTPINMKSPMRKGSKSPVNNRRLNSRLESKNNKNEVKSSSAKVPSIGNDTEISKVPSVNDAPNMRRLRSKLNRNNNDKNTQENDKINSLAAEKNTKNKKENSVAKGSKSPKKNITEISKASLENSTPSTKQPHVQIHNLMIDQNKKNITENSANNGSKSPMKNSTEISKVPRQLRARFDNLNNNKNTMNKIENSAPSSRRQNVKFYNLKNDKNKNTKDEKENSAATGSESPMKNITEASKQPLENSTPSSRRQSEQFDKDEKNEKKSSAAKGSEPLTKTTAPARNVSPRTERRIQDLKQNKKEVNEFKKKIECRIQDLKQNKEEVKEFKKTSNPRELRKRIVIPDRYKDCSLNSPAFKKSEKPLTPNPLDVFEFEYDPKEEPSKKKRTRKYESDSSDDDNSMKFVVKELRKTVKVVSRKPKMQKKTKTKPVPEEQKEIETKVVQKTDKMTEKPTSIITKPVAEQQKKPVVEEQNKEAKQVEETNKMSEKSSVKIVQKVPQISITPCEMVTLEDISDSINLPPDSIDLPPDPIDLPPDPIDLSLPVDPSVQARSIVEEVTKSFLEDLSEDESTNNTIAGVKIISNVLVRKAVPGKPAAPVTPSDIFSSTLNVLKPATPWRIDVSAIRKKPQFFTYKDKSFTPRYEPEFILNDPKSNLKEKLIESKAKRVKLTYQASIVEYINGSKPLINNSADLFKDPPKKVQSPRKILGEINFQQSTPLKPIHANIFKSPNISVISSPKKKSDSMFGFSYFSDDEENKENMRRSPRKSPKKAVILVQEALKPPAPEDITQQKQNDVKQENVTVNETDNSAVDSDLPINLFQELENTEVSKKCTRKYVRKNPLRRRLPSVGSFPSDSESEPEKPVKKKQKNARTKAEEREVDRLASHYNSMFEEIEKHELVIE